MLDVLNRYYLKDHVECSIISQFFEKVILSDIDLEVIRLYQEDYSKALNYYSESIGNYIKEEAVKYIDRLEVLTAIPTYKTYCEYVLYKDWGNESRFLQYLYSHKHNKESIERLLMNLCIRYGNEIERKIK